jgi:hypothetical protein
MNGPDMSARNSVAEPALIGIRQRESVPASALQTMSFAPHSVTMLECDLA